MNSLSIGRIRQWIKDNLVFFGPGILLAVTAAGEAGITEAIEIGAHFDLRLAWVVIITLLFKAAFTIAVARYTLSTGKTIFEGFGELPGFGNYGLYLVICSYVIESLAIGAIVQFAAYFLDYLIPGVYRISGICIVLIILALLVLRTHLYHKFEEIMAVLVIILSIVLVLTLSQFSVSFSLLTQGLVPTIPDHSESAILAIIGVVGSGLNLMLYSVWLERKIRDKRIRENIRTFAGDREFFRRYVRSSRLDIYLGFLLVAVITFGFMMVGSVGFRVSFMPHGTHLTLDALITQIVYVFTGLPYGIYIFFFLVSLIFFGSIVVGLDARAKAIMKIITTLKKKKGREEVTDMEKSKAYVMCLGIFSVMMLISVLIGNPMGLIRMISASSAVLFGIFGFMVIYQDSFLPDYAKGSRFQILMIGIGSALSVYVALLIEGSFLNYGLPLLENMLLCLAVVYVFCRSKLFRKTVAGKADLSDRFWIVAVFGVISVFGTYGGISVSMSEISPALYSFIGSPADEFFTGTYIINFRDLGPMIAGMIGGPFVGAAAALIGGAYRLSLGGPTAVPCFISTICAGLIGGIAIRRMKGRVTVKNAMKTACVAECLHLLVITPVYMFIFMPDSPEKIISVITLSLFPMIIVNAAGLGAFAYFSRRVGIFEGGLQRFSINRLKEEIREMARPDTYDEKILTAGRTETDVSDYIRVRTGYGYEYMMTGTGNTDEKEDQEDREKDESKGREKEGKEKEGREKEALLQK